jgi:hypothetical protein
VEATVEVYCPIAWLPPGQILSPKTAWQNSATDERTTRPAATALGRPLLPGRAETPADGLTTRPAAAASLDLPLPSRDGRTDYPETFYCPVAWPAPAARPDGDGRTESSDYQTCDCCLARTASCGPARRRRTDYQTKLTNWSCAWPVPTARTALQWTGGLSTILSTDDEKKKERKKLRSLPLSLPSLPPSPPPPPPLSLHSLSFPLSPSLFPPPSPLSPPFLSRRRQMHGRTFRLAASPGQPTASPRNRRIGRADPQTACYCFARPAPAVPVRQGCDGRTDYQTCCCCLAPPAPCGPARLARRL